MTMTLDIPKFSGVVRELAEKLPQMKGDLQKKRKQKDAWVDVFSKDPGKYAKLILAIEPEIEQLERDIPRLVKQFEDAYRSLENEVSTVEKLVSNAKKLLSETKGVAK